MALTVATNTGALMAQAAASSVNKEMEISMERLATGKRINGAADDAAGVAIASRLTSEIKGTNQAIRNAMDGQALIDTAEGAHQEIENILQRMRELSVQARNDTNNADDRANLQLEMNALTTEIDRIANSTTWAGQKLLTGSGGNHSTGKFDLQVGSGTASENTISTTIKAMTASALGVGAGNASVGVNGATMSTVGGNVMQINGTATKGDVYNFTINGESVSVEITADDGTDFTFGNIKIDGVALPTTTTNGIFETTDLTLTSLGNDNHAVAKALAAIVNGMADTSATHKATQAGLKATAASDGTVTLIQEVVVTDAVFSDNGTADANTTYSASTNKITFAPGADGDFVADDDKISFKINGIEFDVTAQEALYNTATDEGLTAAIQAELDAHAGSLKGITNLTATDDGTTVSVSWTPAVALTGVSATAGTTTSALDISTSAAAKTSIDAVDAAIKALNNQRASLGSVSNRLDSTVSNLTNISSNLQAGRGRIEDADFAAETTSLAKSQILQQASTAMLAQANASKQNVLSLLQG